MSEIKQKYLEIQIKKHIEKLSKTEMTNLIVNLIRNEHTKVLFVNEFCKNREEMGNILNFSTRKIYRQLDKYNII
jgi:cell fate (sporulation/competence/biofilm development) regulator YmcA (YheA/YmcA/DUF963 family)